MNIGEVTCTYYEAWTDQDQDQVRDLPHKDLKIVSP